MFIAICPTYRRPHLIGNIIEMWHRQVCDVDRHLLILDDAPNFAEGLHGDNWTLLTRQTRYTHLGDKFGALVDIAIRDFSARYIALFEDDDVYFPFYIRDHLRALQSGADVSIPSHIYSNHKCDKGEYFLHETKCSNHGAWAFSADIYCRSAGYPRGVTKAFDYTLLDNFKKANAVISNCCGERPQYLYRWWTASKNGSAFPDDMMTSQDTNPVPDSLVSSVTPNFDYETRGYYESLGYA